jgi:hypothetical protein
VTLSTPNTVTGDVHQLPKELPRAAVHQPDRKWLLALVGEV